METQFGKPDQMWQYLTLLQWLHVQHRFSWYYYLEACSKVRALRHFIESKLPWYLEKRYYSISEEELKSLLYVLGMVDEEHWEKVLSEEDLEERRAIVL